MSEDPSLERGSFNRQVWREISLRIERPEPVSVREMECIWFSTDTVRSGCWQTNSSQCLLDSGSVPCAARRPLRCRASDGVAGGCEGSRRLRREERQAPCAAQRVSGARLADPVRGTSSCGSPSCGRIPTSRNSPNRAGPPKGARRRGPETLEHFRFNLARSPSW